MTTKKPPDLDRFLWKNRILLIFTPLAKLPNYQNWLEEINQNEDGIVDRDLLIFYLIHDSTKRINQNHATQQSLQAWYNTFEVSSNEFQIVLIGKDGGVKAKQKDITLLEIFQRIDAMPMRQAEMKTTINRKIK